METERDNANGQVAEYTEKWESANAITALNEELDNLKAYKLNIETSKRMLLLMSILSICLKKFLSPYRENF